MKIKDPQCGAMVDVVDKLCLKRKCYWPRTDPGSFTQGQGYRSRPGGNRGWICGEREIRGCPHAGVCDKCDTCYLEFEEICRYCGNYVGEV